MSKGFTAKGQLRNRRCELRRTPVLRSNYMWDIWQTFGLTIFIQSGCFVPSDSIILTGLFKERHAWCMSAMKHSRRDPFRVC